MRKVDTQKKVHEAPRSACQSDLLAVLRYLAKHVIHWLQADTRSLHEVHDGGSIGPKGYQRPW
jgi:hypothetical protein